MRSRYFFSYEKKNARTIWTGEMKMPWRLSYESERERFNHYIHSPCCFHWRKENSSSKVSFDHLHLLSKENERLVVWDALVHPDDERSMEFY